MAIVKILMVVLPLMGIVFHLVQSHDLLVIQNVANSPAPAPQSIDCGGACAIRCQLSSRPRLCKRACGTCCARCGCVPPGTSAHYEVCPRYANMTTRDGKRKCP